jgi:hypothetical protein
MEYEQYLNVPWWWKYGRPKDMWATFEHEIGIFIEKNKIAAMSHEAAQSLIIGEVGGGMAAPAAIAMKSASSSPMERIWWHGGMRGPHLHYKNNIYVLTDKQWKEFTRPILKTFGEKLATTRSISFRDMTDIAGMMNGISGE